MIVIALDKRWLKNVEYFPGLEPFAGLLGPIFIELGLRLRALIYIYNFAHIIY